mmetsp:Transcript_96050/g.117705  ORF Transcript_96050/g.117705 Transcript_96050/m.117705 type:complete len:256 (-) Transcript_96050:833-1600(-)
MLCPGQLIGLGTRMDQRGEAGHIRLAALRGHVFEAPLCLLHITSFGTSADEGIVHAACDLPLFPFPARQKIFEAIHVAQLAHGMEELVHHGQVAIHAMVQHALVPVFSAASVACPHASFQDGQETGRIGLNASRHQAFHACFSSRDILGGSIVRQHDIEARHATLICAALAQANRLHDLLACGVATDPSAFHQQLPRHRIRHHSMLPHFVDTCNSLLPISLSKVAAQHEIEAASVGPKASCKNGLQQLFSLCQTA